MSLITEASSAIEIFYSYAHEDERWRKKLETHLSTMRRQGLISGWHDRNISAGAEWQQEIKKHLNTSQIILLLISPDFMASDYCYSIEMNRALERHDSGEACVIPIILRPVDVEGTPFGKLEMLPTGGRAVTSWTDHDEAFLNVTQGIRKIVQKSLAKTKEQWFDEGLAYHKARHYEQALKAYEQALQLDPIYARVHRSKGDVLYELKHYEEALTAYEQAIRLDPNHVRIYRNIGDILWRLKHHDEALAAYEQAIRLDPYAAHLYNDKGNILYSVKRYTEALAAYEDATRFDPSFAYAYNNKGNALSRLTHFLEAIVAYDQAIRLNTHDALPYNNKGRAFYHLGRFHEALIAFEQAVHLDPNFAGAYTNMADALEQLGRVKEATVARAQAQQTAR